MKTAYLSLGSNLGDRAAQLRTAIEKLSDARLRIVRISSVYDTAPRDNQDQPRFLNIVVEIETQRFPMQLLGHCLRVEKEMGRQRLGPKSARNIDIDVLLYGQHVIDSPKLVVPHIRMHQRRFVLEPLCELAPEVRHPVFRKTVRELLAELADQGVRKVGPLVE